MADIYVMNQDSRGSGPFQYLTGFVPDIFEDGQIGPGSQQHPFHYIIRLPGVPKAQLQFLLEGRLGFADENGERPVTHRRRDYFDRAKLPAVVRNQLAQDREITLNITAAQIQTYVTRYLEDAP